MNSVKIIVGFSRLTDNALIDKCQHIITSMTANVNYTAPNPAPINPTIATLTTNRTNFVQAKADSNDGKAGIEKTAAKNAKRKILIDSLVLLGGFVQINCQNNVSIALSSGFDIRQSSQPIGQLPKPDNFKAELKGNPGSMHLSCNSVKGADSYVFEYTPFPSPPNAVWASKPSSKASVEVAGLNLGMQYSFRVAGIGAFDVLIYSDVITRFVS